MNYSAFHHKFSKIWSHLFQFSRNRFKWNGALNLKSRRMKILKCKYFGTLNVSREKLLLWILLFIEQRILITRMKNSCLVFQAKKGKTLNLIKLSWILIPSLHELETYFDCNFALINMDHCHIWMSSFILNDHENQCTL